MREQELHEAEYYNKKEGNIVQCVLCPRNCIIKPGKLGSCQARKNVKGKLYALGYNYFTSSHADPIEKKPLYHFKPGSRAMSFGTAGCNLHCDFCQNFQISQISAESNFLRKITAEEAISITKQHKCDTIAYTYNEPLINFEWIKETGRLAREHDIGNVLVSNGMLNDDPIDEIIEVIDAANIDIKAFNMPFYRDIAHFPGLEQIKKNAVKMHQRGVHVELTMLVIPGYNDKFEEIESFARWVLEKMDDKTPIHFSRFYPHYKMRDVPPTPVETIMKCKEIAEENGLKYVFVGNLPAGEINSTQCQNCGTILVTRVYYNINIRSLKNNGTCSKCGVQSDIKI